VTIIHKYGDWYTGRWWVSCCIWYSEEGTERARAPPSPLLAAPNVTAHPSTASVPTSYYFMWHYTVVVVTDVLMYLSCIISEIKRDIGRKSRLSFTVWYFVRCFEADKSEDGRYMYVVGVIVGSSLQYSDTVVNAANVSLNITKICLLRNCVYW